MGRNILADRRAGAVAPDTKRATHGPAMQRGSLVVFGVLLVAVVAVVALRAKTPASKATTTASASASASGSAPKPAASVPASPDGGTGTDLLGAERVTEADSKGFDRMPGGGPVPELAATAPKTVGFGAILFSYKGAQYAPSDAPPKEQARAKAAALIPDATKDFTEAVKKGDRGSTGDAGRIPRGMLEPYPEYVLFTLEKGKVHPEPVDTPRGFWIVKRND